MEPDKKLIPEELVEIWYEHVAAKESRDAAVKGIFKYQLRNALYFGKIAEKKHNEFWGRIRELYPELSGKTLQLDLVDNLVWVKDKKE